jgi:membrane protease subunit HflC
MKSPSALVGALLGISLLAVGFLALVSVYTVDPTEQVIITQFGEPQGEPVREAGLHFRFLSSSR